MLEITGYNFFDFIFYKHYTMIKYNMQYAPFTVKKLITWCTYYL